MKNFAGSIPVDVDTRYAKQGIIMIPGTDVMLRTVTLIQMAFRSTRDSEDGIQTKTHLMPPEYYSMCLPAA